MVRPVAENFIVIPAFNEEASIGNVVARCLALESFQVVVVDDVSRDNTAVAARAAGARVLSLPIHLGAWGAVQTGLRYALRHGGKTFVTLDGDGQHRPEDVPLLLDPVLSDSADMVIGSCPQRGSRARAMAWAFFKVITDLPVNDLTSGFRAYNKKAACLMASKHAVLLDYQDIGVLLLAYRKGLRVQEVPVPMCPRANGISRIYRNWGAVFRYLIYSTCVGVSKRRYVPFGRVIGGR